MCLVNDGNNIIPVNPARSGHWILPPVAYRISASRLNSVSWRDRSPVVKATLSQGWLCATREAGLRAFARLGWKQTTLRFAQSWDMAVMGLELHCLPKSRLRPGSERKRLKRMEDEVPCRSSGIYVEFVYTNPTFLIESLASQPEGCPLFGGVIALYMVNRLFHNQNVLFYNQNVLFLNQGLFHNQTVLFFNHEVLFLNQRLFHN